VNRKTDWRVVEANKKKTEEQKNRRKQKTDWRVVEANKKKRTAIRNVNEQREKRSK
jgi:hypothetical protein